MFTYNNRYIPYRNLACFAVESAGIFLSVLLSYFLLYGRSDAAVISFQDIVVRGLIIAVFAQFCMYILDLYDLNIAFSTFEILFSALFTTGFVFIFIGLFSYLVPALGIAGDIYYVSGLILFLFVLLWRSIINFYIERHSPNRNIAILGDGAIAEELASLVASSGRIGFRFAGFAAGKIERPGEGNPRGAKVMDFDDLKEAAGRGEVDEVIVALEDRRKNLPVRRLLDLKLRGIRIIEWPEFYEKLSGKIPVKNLPPSYFIFNEGFSPTQLSVTFSRIFSFIVSLAGLVACAPLFLVVAALIKLDSPGSVFYRQERVGEKSRPFLLIKFRTMVQDAENGTGPVWAGKDDPRITRVGRYLRRYRIDEIPQFLNVLKGEMNLVGPRPERPEFVKVLENEVPYYSLRQTIKPGVTGWGQVKHSYSGNIDESREKLEHDLFYIKNRTFMLELYILFKTVKVLLLGRGSR